MNYPGMQIDILEVFVEASRIGYRKPRRVWQAWRAYLAVNKRRQREYRRKLYQADKQLRVRYADYPSNPSR